MVTIQGVTFFKHPKKKDHRGYFQRISEFSEMAEILPEPFIQSSISFNATKGTIRGLHFQAFPSEEWKYVTCISGALFDCLVDVRRNSLTYGKHASFELSEENGVSVLIPPGVAHGFQTLEENTVIIYQMVDVYNSSLSRNLLWNDKYLNIQWPLKTSEISDSDAQGQPWPVVY